MMVSSDRCIFHKVNKPNIFYHNYLQKVVPIINIYYVQKQYVVKQYLRFTQFYMNFLHYIKEPVKVGWAHGTNGTGLMKRG